MADVVVVGAGIGGLASAIAFARAGHRVTLVERDPAPPPPEPGRSFLEWERPGVPQRRLVHGFLPLARRLLRENVPDLVERLLTAGAHDVDLLEPVVGREPRPGDEELFALRCRRTVFEWMLRRAAEEDPRVTVMAGQVVAGLIGRPADGGRPARVDGVRLGADTLPATLVVDASGRRSRVGGWLAELGVPEPEVEARPCGRVYYSRFYERPEDGFPVAHRAALGYAEATSVAADGRTFCLTFFARSEVPGLRRLSDAAAFERAVATLPGLGPWREGARPLGGVNSMGSLENRIRRFAPGGHPVAEGLILVGDSLSHTDPKLGRGMSLALDQAFRAARLAWTAGDRLESALRYHADVDPVAEASYSDAANFDDLSARIFAGDESAREDPRALVGMACEVAAARDQDLFRACTRHHGLLVIPGSLATEPWVGRARAVLARPPGADAGPDQERMLTILGGDAT